jgi:ATP-dependent exoDNAse (exonuclease V) alpha subunit
VRAVAASGNGVDVIEALAGTGKTYTAGVLREVYAAAGYPVIGVAPSARAARELTEQAGIPARTLDSRLLAIANGFCCLTAVS